MPDEVEIRVPDIGDFEDVEVVEILVGPGDVVAVEDPLVSIESDKATMEIPSPYAGKIGKILVSEGDKISEGLDLVDHLSIVSHLRFGSREMAVPKQRNFLFHCFR